MVRLTGEELTSVQPSSSGGFFGSILPRVTAAAQRVQSYAPPRRKRNWWEEDDVPGWEEPAYGVPQEAPPPLYAEPPPEPLAAAPYERQMVEEFAAQQGYGDDVRARMQDVSEFPQPVEDDGGGGFGWGSIKRGLSEAGKTVAMPFSLGQVRPEWMGEEQAPPPEGRPGLLDSFGRASMSALQTTGTALGTDELAQRAGYDPSGLPNPWYFPAETVARQAATPGNYIGAMFAPSVPIIGSTFGGSYAGRAAGEVGLSALGVTGSEQAAQQLPEDIPLVPEWADPYARGAAVVGAGMATALGGIGAYKGLKGGVKNADAGMRAIDAKVNEPAYARAGQATSQPMVFQKGRIPGDERTVIPDSSTYTPELDKILKEEELAWNRYEDAWQAHGEESSQAQRELAAFDALKTKKMEIVANGYEGKPTPLARERLWFHSTRDMTYDLPDPDLAVGTQTGITQGPGIYMAADPSKSAGNYGPRTFVAEFDGNTLDLTKPTTADAPLFAGGPTWVAIRDDIAARIERLAADSPPTPEAFKALPEGVKRLPQEAAGAIDDATGKLRWFPTHEDSTQFQMATQRYIAQSLAGKKIRDAFSPRNLERAREHTYAALGRQIPDSGYVYKQALSDAVYNYALDVGGLPNDILGRFKSLNESPQMARLSTAAAAVQNTLADNGVDALFHHSPHADGDVLIVLNGEKARALGEVRNGADVVKSGKTWREMVGGGRKASDSTVRSFGRAKPRVDARGNTVAGMVVDRPGRKRPTGPASRGMDVPEKPVARVSGESEPHIDALAKHGIDFGFDEAGNIVVDDVARAEGVLGQLEREYANLITQKGPGWQPGNKTKLFGSKNAPKDDGTGGVNYRKKERGGQTIEADLSPGSIDHATLDDAARLTEILNPEGVDFAAAEAMRAKFPKDAKLPTLARFESSGQSGAAKQRGATAADEFVAARIRPDYSPANVKIEVQAESSRVRALAPGDARLTTKQQAYIDRLTEWEAKIDWDGGDFARPEAPVARAEPPVVPPRKPPTATAAPEPMPEPRTPREAAQAIVRDDGIPNIAAVADKTPEARRSIFKKFAPIGERENRPKGGIFDEVAPTERVERGIMARYEGGTGVANTVVNRELRDGNKALRALGIGRSDGRRLVVQKSDDVVALYKALHGEGPVPPRLQGVYDDIKRVVAQETEETLADNPDFILRDDYFYRGWRQPKQTSAGTRKVGGVPGFKKPRVDATFTELIAEGWEPASWNPYEMLALRRRAGLMYREANDLVGRLKEAGIAEPVKVGERVPDGYSIPRVGPAFEGKQHAYVPDMPPGELPVGAKIATTTRYALPDELAAKVEAIFGTEPKWGNIDKILSVGEKMKRAKLLASLFQQVDFTTRTASSGFGAAIDALVTGKPLRAVVELANVPVSIGKLMWANLSPSRRASLADQLLSDKPLFEGRDVSLLSIAKAGWSSSDNQIVRDVVKATLDDVQRELPKGATAASKPWRVAKGINQATQNGLFDGVYRQAGMTAAEHHIGPRILRQHPDWTDAQISRAIADQLNERFSTLGAYQSVFQAPAVRKVMRGLFFSTNESESLLRQSIAPFVGPNKALTAEYWAGGFLFLATVAETVHYLTTGEHLPVERLQPLELDEHSPLNVKYRGNFLAPDIPIKGRGGTNMTIDLVGQLDTAFRVLDPKAFLTARENVLPRTITTQVTGKDFFGRPVGGVKERLTNLATDAFEPIGAGQVRQAFDIGPESEARVGLAGGLIQGSGLNVRAETNAMLKDRKAREKFGRGWEDLEPFEQASLISQDEGLRKELDKRRDEAVAQGSSYAITQEQVEEWRDDARTGQETDDVAFAKGEIDGERYREREDDRLRTLRGRIEGIRATSEPYKGKGDDPLARFGVVLQSAISPDGVDIDHERIDAFFSSLTADEQAYISRNTGLRDTPLQKSKDADVRSIAASGVWDMEKGRTQFLREHPEVRKLMKTWGYSQNITKYLDEEDKYNAEQALDDAKLGRGELTRLQWKDRYHDRTLKLRAAGEGIFEDMPDDGTNPLAGYYEAIDRYTEAGNVNWRKVDQWVAQQPAELQTAIDSRVTGGLNTPRVKAYREAVKKVAASGYWDMGDKLAARFARRFGLTADIGADEMQQAVFMKERDKLLARGMSPLEADMRADIIADRKLRGFTSLLSKQRQLFRRKRANRDIAVLLVDFGWWEPGIEDTARLSRYVA